MNNCEVLRFGGFFQKAIGNSSQIWRTFSVNTLIFSDLMFFSRLKCEVLKFGGFVKGTIVSFILFSTHFRNSCIYNSNLSVLGKPA